MYGRKASLVLDRRKQCVFWHGFSLSCYTVARSVINIGALPNRQTRPYHESDHTSIGPLLRIFPSMNSYPLLAFLFIDSICPSLLSDLQHHPDLAKMAATTLKRVAVATIANLTSILTPSIAISLPALSPSPAALNTTSSLHVPTVSMSPQAASTNATPLRKQDTITYHTAPDAHQTYRRYLGPQLHERQKRSISL